MNTNKTKNPKFSEWLEDLQQESWQLELLISGFVIYGLFAAKPYINEVTRFLMASNDLTLFIGALISASLPLAWYVFVCNLLIHVFIRGLWIGSVGLRYVSGDIDYEELNYSKVFTEYYNKKYGSFDNFILKLEKISSIIFSITFLIFFIFFSTLIYIGILIYIGNFAFDPESFILFRFLGYIFFGILILGGFLIVLDFLSIGGLKRIKNKYFSKAYFKINKLVSTVTLAILWKPLLLNFLDHKFSRLVFIMSVPYAILVSILLPNLFIDSNVYHPDFMKDSLYPEVVAGESYNYYYYEDELEQFMGDQEETVLREILLKSKKINGQIMEVFVNSHPEDDILIKHFNSNAFQLYEGGLKNKTFESFKAGYDSTSLQDSLIHNNSDAFSKNLKSIKRTLSNVVEFSINEKAIKKSKVNCDFYMHPINQTKGMLCILTVDSLLVGRNTFTFKRLIGNKSESNPIKETKLDIPFIYEN